MPFKDEIFAICHEVATEFEGWSFQSSGMFKNKILKHTDLIIDPGFHFEGGMSCSVSPMAAVDNRKVGKLFKHLTGMVPYYTLAIDFRMESSDYYYTNPSNVSSIFPGKIAFNNSQGVPQMWPNSFIVQAQAKEYFRKVVRDGINFLSKHFDLTTEENLLRHLPTSYKWMDKGMNNAGLPGSYYEKRDGIMLCLAHIVLGDFTFVEHYASDDFKTMFPKHTELKKIIAALPELKRRFAEAGHIA
jgi:hypothetical protein